MIARIAYGATFTLVLPATLVAWAWGLSCLTDLPQIHEPWTGSVISLAGIALMLWAMLNLWRLGGGLPMNAFPPSRLVVKGAFRFFAHPIYIGFTTACAGVSVLVGSASGFWIVSPVLALGCASLVWGYERDATFARFGVEDRRTRLSLPSDENAAADRWDRFSIYALVLLPWLILYELIGHLPVPDAIDVRLPLERGWPVWAWTHPFYASTYVMVLLSPLVARTRRELRNFAIVGLTGTTIGMLCYLVIPFIAPPRPIEGHGLFARMLHLERLDGLDGRAAYPAFHVFWTIAAAAVFAHRWPQARAIIWSWAALASAACITTGMHATADVAAGALLGFISIRWRNIITACVRATERLANSWREWRLGPVRVISHSIFAGSAAFTGMVVACAVMDRQAPPLLAFVAIATLFGAGLWGQALVGAPNSLRPFGYFGAVLGAAVGLLLLAAFGALDWSLAAALAIAAPWVLVVGRMRCLVQGCCHGRPTDVWWAIRYRHPRSRVCRVAGLCEIGVHPTPLYSMAGNAIIGLLLLRLWSVGAGAAMIAGFYLILAGMLRFVEEQYRGEPHTPYRCGLRIYQWCAVASVLAGIAITVIPSRPLSAPAFDAAMFAWAIAIGLVYALAMGVDFPESDRRFARLT